MPARLAITALVCRQIVFSEQITAVEDGRPITRPTPSSVKTWWLADSVQTGLWIRVSPGSVSWYVRRKMGGQTTSRQMGPVMRPGAASAALDVAAARKRALKWLSHMASGDDPIQIRKARQAATKAAQKRDKTTMGVAFIEYCQSEKGKESTSTDRRKVVKWMSSSPIWHLPISDITRESVEASLGPLLLRARGLAAPPHRWGPQSISAGTLSKIYAYMAAAWAQAARQLQIPVGRNDGPWALWRRPQSWPEQVERDTMLDTDTDQGVAWWRELVAFRERAQAPEVLNNRPDPRGKELKPHVSVLLDYYILLLLWGTRARETSLIEWSAVRFDKNIVLLDGRTTKSGHTGSVPLTIWAKEILLRRRDLNLAWRPDAPSPFVFPSRQHGKPIANARSILDALNRATGLSITAHDLRRTMATELNGVEVDLDQAARLVFAGTALHHKRKLGSMVGAATSRYLLREAEATRPAFQAREDRLRRLAGLHVEDGDQGGMTPTDALLAQALKDPTFQRRYFEHLAKAK